MAKASDPNNPKRPSNDSNPPIDSPLIRDKALMLNGGNPISIGFNVNITLNPANKSTFKELIQKPDSHLFPVGLRGLPDTFPDFVSKIEPTFLPWLEKADNMKVFTATPLAAVQKFCSENKIEMPPDIAKFLGSVHRSYAGLNYTAPGVRFKTVTASVRKQNK